MYLTEFDPHIRCCHHRLVPHIHGAFINLALGSIPPHPTIPKPVLLWIPRPLCEELHVIFRGFTYLGAFQLRNESKSIAFTDPKEP